MLSLTDRRALRRAIRDPALDPHLRAVLRLRLRQTGGEGADFHVVQSTDTIANAERVIGFQLTDEGAPCWEWLQRHSGGIAEACFIISDDGPAQVLLVPDDADASITDVLRTHAA